ncbi:MAG: bifunctional ornithine acetyltransferase/N-acetylglutamate synthase, partial [Alphaproteobacteria bacterium]
MAVSKTAFTGLEGEKAVLETAKAVAKNLDCHENEVYISSTGVIGENLPYEKIVNAIPFLCNNFSNSQIAWDNASKSIMTTDTKPKLVTKTCQIYGKTIEIIGFAKGSGMIAP